MLPGGLPGHLFQGRGSMSGPVSGGYVVLSGGPKTASTTPGTRLQIVLAYLPFKYRLHAIGWHCTTPYSSTKMCAGYGAAFADVYTAPHIFSNNAITCEIDEHPSGVLRSTAAESDTTSEGNVYLAVHEIDGTTYPYFGLALSSLGGDTEDFSMYAVIQPMTHPNTSPADD